MNGINSKRVGGLVSGMNTDEIVAGMLQNSQNKIDKQYRNKQSTLWKQEAYRTIIRSVNSFKNKWFNVLDSSHNLGSPAFWNLSKVTSSSSNFTVNAGSASANTNVKVDYIKQLATNETLTSNNSLSSTIETDLSNSILNSSPDGVKYFEAFSAEIGRLQGTGAKPSISVTVDGVTKNIEYDVGGKYDETKKAIVDANGNALSQGDVFANMYASANQSLKNAFGTDTNGKQKVELAWQKNSSTDPSAITGMEVKTNGNSKVTFENAGFFGFQDGSSNKVNTYSSIGSLGQNISGGSYEFNINGIDFKFSSKDSLSKVMSEINSSEAGVKMSYSEFSDKFTLTSNTTGSGNNIAITQKSGDLMTKLFGAKNSNNLSSAGLNGPLIGSEKFNSDAIKNNIGSPFTITVDGVSKDIYIPVRDSRGNKIDYSKYKDDQLVNLFQTEINNAFDEKKLNVSMIGGKFSITHDDGAEVKISATKGDTTMLKNMGFTDGATNAVLDTTTLKDLGITGNQKITVTKKDGTNVVIDFTEATTIKEFNDKLNASGTGLTAKLTESNSATGEKGGKLSIDGFDNVSSVKQTEGNAMNKLFGTGEYGSMTQLSQFKLSNLGVTGTQTVTIGGNAVTFDGSEDLKTVMEKMTAASGGKVNFSFNSDNKLIIDGLTKNGISIEQAAGNNILNNVFGLASGNNKIDNDIISGLDMSTVSATKKEGQNSILSINGTEIERASNTVEVDGVQITATKTFNETAEVGKGETITVASDVEDSVKKIKEFMEDYNKMIDEAQNRLTEKDYKEYQPLTEAQKKEMSKEQIEAWESKAKSGKIKGDTNVTKFLQDLRMSMYEKTGSGLAMYDIGITTGDWHDGGKLKFADNLSGGKTGEQVLRDMLSKNPEQVKQMFTETETGFADRLKKITASATDTSISNRGYLANIAGLEGTFSDGDNLLSNQVSTIDATIKKYQLSMKAEESRYWQQFTALEKLVSQMNAQSSWLTQQMG